MVMCDIESNTILIESMIDVSEKYAGSLPKIDKKAEVRRHHST